MRIVDPGPDPSVEILGTCKMCGCRFAYVPADVHTMTDCDGDSFYSVKCPGCKKTMNVKRPL